MIGNRPNIMLFVFDERVDTRTKQAIGHINQFLELGLGVVDAAAVGIDGDGKTAACPELPDQRTDGIRQGDREKARARKKP